MNRFRPVAIVLAAFLLLPCILRAYDWELVKNENGIEVYVKPVENSEIREFMAVTTAATSLSAVLALLDDTGSYTKWNYRCGEAKLLYRKNDLERITYMVTTSPWPVDDRDIAVKSVISQDKKTGVVTITLTGLPDYTPARDGKVRMKSLRGYWRLEPLGKGKVKIIYRLHTEPGGSVPDSLVNSSLVDIPYNTVYNMKKMIQSDPYRDAHYSTITEKE